MGLTTVDWGQFALPIAAALGMTAMRQRDVRCSVGVVSGAAAVSLALMLVMWTTAKSRPAPE